MLPVFLAVASASDYAGAEACRKCHPAEYEAQSKSEHATALARSLPSQQGEWAFGAGSQAITFVARRDAASYVELGETWYRRIDGLALTPGHHDRKGVPYRIFDPSAAILRCFACHSTGPISVGTDDSIHPLELGIRCEACHGAAAEHARNPAAKRMADPKRLSADAQNHLCGECHRMPAAAGDSTNLHNPWNARHQPLLLAESACFRESSGRLSCVTCHSPHASLERNTAAYDARCRECHNTPRHLTPVASRSCVDCHMPKARPGSYLAFTNHRIAVYAAADPMTPVTYRKPR